MKVIFNFLLIFSIAFLTDKLLFIYSFTKTDITAELFLIFSFLVVLPKILLILDDCVLREHFGKKTLFFCFFLGLTGVTGYYFFNLKPIIISSFFVIACRLTLDINAYYVSDKEQFVLSFLSTNSLPVIGVLIASVAATNRAIFGFTVGICILVVQFVYVYIKSNANNIPDNNDCVACLSDTSTRGSVIKSIGLVCIINLLIILTLLVEL